MSRPWSAAEVEARIPELVERIESALTDLHDLGVNAAQTKWAYERAKSLAWVAAIDHFDRVNKRTAKEEREAWVMTEWRDASRGRLDVCDFGLAKDLAENAYRDARTLLSSLDTELKVAQTLIVSARAVA